MKNVNRSIRMIISFIALSSIISCGQETKGWQVDKMPIDLETDFALSALPEHLRDGATVYLLDPQKGYYVGKQGTNGFAALVVRTEWEWAEFVPDSYTAVSYDAEGVKTYLPAYFAVAEMRATGKYSPQQIKDAMIKRIKDGTYKAPSRPGLSYMLCPVHRTHVDARGVINQILPHYMFYAPGVDNSDIGGKWDGHSPFAIGSGEFLDKKNSIFNYIIVPVGETEKAKIVEDNKELYNRLVAYRNYFKMEASEPVKEHHH